MELNFNSLEHFYQNLAEMLPSILKGILFLIIAIFFYWIIILIFNKILKVMKVDRLNAQINNIELLRENSISINIHKIIINTVKFLLILFLIIIGADLLHLPMVSELVGNLLEYLPKFFIAVLIFVGGTYLASRAKSLIQNMLKSIDANGSKAVGAIVFYLIFIFVCITALNQAGINTEIISNNVSFILGALLVTLTIAIGLGSRDIVYRLILGFYTKKNLDVGMKIQVEDKIGVIESIDNICLVLVTEDERIVFPIKKINDTEIKILK